ncbi:MAG: TonB-dependent receptor, partial [Deltaproteobacteria bacterium]|nr:TonB-dependent receptor [Deltaproteobacteria bacterium]
LWYEPSFLGGSRVELEWLKLGKYWLDDANTEQYEGHDLLNIRALYKLNKSWELYARAMNVTDELYAESASKSSSGSASYNPGMPRTFYAGITYHWRK